MSNEKTISTKYRPTKLSECVLPTRIRKRLDKWKDKKANHLIFYGSAGIGKTSTARALANEISPDNTHYINASKFNDDNFINGYLTKLMTSASLYNHQKKIIILDESDRLTENAQTSLRVPLEEYSHLCSVIFTFNYNDKIIAPIKSRCIEFNFDLDNEEVADVKDSFKKRLLKISKLEKRKLSNDMTDEIINMHFPDMRKCVSELEFV
jgi:replication factor C small subunit